MNLTLPGPYDELILIPGNFTVPQPSAGPPKVPKKALRIARIFVSQRTTTYNGRLNWNIPKHLARFSFSAPPTPKGSSPPAQLTVKVFPPGTTDGDGTYPFFACTLTPWKWIPAVPVSTAWIPLDLTQVQPPIPEPAGHKEAVKAEIEGPPIDPYDTNPKHEMALCAGTDRWCAYNITSKVPSARGCWVEVQKTGEEADGSERFFPQGLQPWSFGGWMEDAVLDITAPIEWKL